MQTRIKPARDETLFNLCLLTAFFMLVEFSYYLQCNRAFILDYFSVAKTLSIPYAILPGIIYFICVQFAIHIAFCLALWMIIKSFFNLLQVLPQRRLGYTIAIWVLSITAILTANLYYFPNSRFAEMTSYIFIHPVIANWTLLVSVTILAILVMIAIMDLFYRYLFYMLSLVLMALVPLFLFSQSENKNHFTASASRPNIILIGMDSVRPDILSYSGSDISTPFIDSILEKSTVFAEAVTPLARTFPAWTSILTGQYPREVGIRSDLSDQSHARLDSTLSAILQREGYETIYATDETRFSNIDKNFGFDKIISPPMGLNDFLIGTFNDFPMSNLLVNTVIGKKLFPHSYASRAVYFTYYPDTFLQLLKPVLQQSHDRPLLLAVHFCLPHLPYMWADYAGSNLTMQERYVASIVRFDKQLQDFFTLLKDSQLLEHAVVVLLSDHGEALEWNGDRITEKDLYLPANKKVPQFYPPSLDEEDFNQSAGHGTDVLGLPQYHAVLAFRTYGVGKSYTGNIAGVVTLLDIKPTVLDFLRLPAPASSGVSLRPVIEQRAKTYPARHIFMESDYTPAAIRTVYPKLLDAVRESVVMFQIDQKTTRVTMREELSGVVLGSKQYADIYGEWMLALYPQDQDYRLPILINLNSGQWTTDLSSQFAQQSPAQLMLGELRAFYQQEIRNVSGVTLSSK